MVHRIARVLDVQRLIFFDEGLQVTFDAMPGDSVLVSLMDEQVVRIPLAQRDKWSHILIEGGGVLGGGGGGFPKLNTDFDWGGTRTGPRASRHRGAQERDEQVRIPH